MKFVIDDTEYEAANLERITGLYALDLPKQAGIGVQTLAKRLEEMSRLGYDADENPVVLPVGAPEIDGTAVMDSEPHLRALLAFLWVSRRVGGEPRLTFDEAASFEFLSLQILSDEPDEVEPEDVTPDPPSPSGGAADGVAAQV